MTAWTAAELDAVAGAEELEITAPGPGGVLRNWVPIWVVRAGDELYIRSWKGRRSGWFRHAVAEHVGRIRAGGVEAEVRFEEVPAGEPVHADIDAAYGAKYARFPDYVPPMLTPTAVEATLRLLTR